VANSKRKPGNRKPISSHPLFPAVVALWFGALFGLGSLAIRPTLIESLVLKTGIDLVIPAAAPPLGVTARILIALVMASLGAALGAMLTLRLNRPKTVVRERKRNAINPGGAATAEAAMWNQRDIFTNGPACRPISAHEELGDALDSPVQVGNRRRALAVAEHQEQPFQPLEAAPLPGGQPQIFDIANTELDPDSLAPAPVEELAPLDLGAFAAPIQDPAPAMPMAPQPVLDWSAPPVAPAQPMSALAFEPALPVTAEPPRIFGVTAENGHVPVEFVRAAGFRTSVFDSDPAAPLFVDRPAAAEIEPGEAPIAAPAASAPICEPPLPPEQPIALEPSVTIEFQPIPANLGMTDLAQRLQESMARRRAAKAEPASAVPSPEAPAALLEPAAAVPSEFGLPAPGQPAFVPPPPIPVYTAPPFAAPSPAAVAAAGPNPMPAALRPVAFDLPEEDEPVDLAQLMPRHLAMPQGTPFTPAAAAPVAAQPSVDFAAEEADEPAPTQPDEDAFASLLSIETPRQEFVRIEEPEQPAAAVEPVVIFPGQMAAAQPMAMRPFDAPAAAVAGGPVAAAATAPTVDPAEAELALRSALANLQRISGVA